MAPASRIRGRPALTSIKPAASSAALDLGQGRVPPAGGNCRQSEHPPPSGTAVKEDNITPKLIFALAVFAAVSFAVWSGMVTSVEAPVQATHATGMLTPF